MTVAQLSALAAAENPKRKTKAPETDNATALAMFAALPIAD